MKCLRTAWMPFVLLSLIGVGAAQAQVTNFSTDVATAIDNGLAYLDSIGAYNNPSSSGDAAGLTLLALLEKRVSTDQNAVAQGYANAAAADQARMETAIAYILNRVNATGGSLSSYRDGGFLMALSLYLRSGGPEIGGAPLTLIQAINQVFDRIVPHQSARGYWCYSNAGCDDSSTTQFVIAGLAAARGVYSDALYSDPARLATLNTLATNARTGYGIPPGGFAVASSSPCNNIDPGNEYGHGYRRGNAASHQQTASGTWIQQVGGGNVNDPSVQAYVRWLYNRYRYTDISGSPWNPGSYWYYLWSSFKAYEFIEDSGVVPAAGNVGPDDLGTLAAGDAPACNLREVHRDPALDSRVPSFGPDGPGYYADPAEPQRVYYDYAYRIMSLQGGNGQWTGPGGHNNNSRNAYAILVLSRSTGGGCIDTDQDGVCDSDDICPNDPNDACGFVMCQVDGDDDIDINDIRAIMGARGQQADGDEDPRDANGNGIIGVDDGRLCVLQCTLPRCAPVPG